MQTGENLNNRCSLRCLNVFKPGLQYLQRLEKIQRSSWILITRWSKNVWQGIRWDLHLLSIVTNQLLSDFWRPHSTKKNVVLTSLNASDLWLISIGCAQTKSKTNLSLKANFEDDYFTEQPYQLAFVPVERSSQIFKIQKIHIVFEEKWTFFKGEAKIISSTKTTLNDRVIKILLSKTENNHAQELGLILTRNI